MELWRQVKGAGRCGHHAGSCIAVAPCGLPPPRTGPREDLPGSRQLFAHNSLPLCSSPDVTRATVTCCPPARSQSHAETNISRPLGGPAVWDRKTDPPAPSLLPGKASGILHWLEGGRTQAPWEPSQQHVCSWSRSFGASSGSRTSTLSGQPRGLGWSGSSGPHSALRSHPAAKEGRWDQGHCPRACPLSSSSGSGFWALSSQGFPALHLPGADQCPGGATLHREGRVREMETRLAFPSTPVPAPSWE